MPEIIKHEIRSPELQEVMSEIPGRFLRWGLFLFFAIIVAILGVTWFINYPDIVTAPVTITSYNSPSSLVAKTNGNISKLFVVNEEFIKANRPIALIENQADWNDVITVIGIIDSMKDINDWENIVRHFETPSGLTLGEIQSSWLRFANSFHKYGEYISQAYIPSKVKLLERQIDRQIEYISELKNQQLLSEEDLRLSFKSYQRDSGLFENNNYSISISQLEKSKQALLQKQITFSSLLSSIKNSESSILKMKESLLDLKIQYEKEMNQYLSDLDESLQMLKVAIGQWKERYLISQGVSSPKLCFA